MNPVTTESVSPALITALSRGSNKKAAVDGDVENGFVLAGMSLTHLTKVESVSDIMNQLVTETESALKKGPSLI